MCTPRPSRTSSTPYHDYPSLAAVDRAVFIGIVEAHLRPLDPDRPWLRRRWQAPRGEALWLSGAVGLCVPTPREAA